MNTKQAQELRIGDEVRHTVDDVPGLVTRATLQTVTIRWLDKTVSTHWSYEMAEIDFIGRKS